MNTHAKPVSAIETPAAETPALVAPLKPVGAAPVPEPMRAPKKRNGRRFFLMISLPLVIAAAGGYFWLHGGRYQDTDNAYVQQPKLSLSSDVPGRIIDVRVHENETIHKGDVLFQIDPEPYQIAVLQADASLAAARNSVEQLRVAYSAAQTKLKSAEQTLDIRQREQGRSANLATMGVATQASVDQQLIALQQAESDVEQDKQSVNAALAALNGNADIQSDDMPLVKQALAADENANRNLTKTTVLAPANGVISQVTSLNVGQYVPAGTTIVNLVETDDTWVVANFKETQLEGLKDGQLVDVAVDAYPNGKLQGSVDSIGAATGSEFSLIPAQNATGNWVKVVQRVPVRIKVQALPGQPLRTGMSATVTVDTGKSRLDGLKETYPVLKTLQ